jgi:hypothetical protein
MEHRGHAPHGDRHRHAPARPEPVEQTPDEQQADAVAELEGGNDVAVVDLAPAEVFLDDRLEHAEHLAIDVVDGDDEEQQRADRPAVASDPRTFVSCRRRHP